MRCWRFSELSMGKPRCSSPTMTSLRIQHVTFRKQTGAWVGLHTDQPSSMTGTVKLLPGKHNRIRRFVVIAAKCYAATTEQEKTTAKRGSRGKRGKTPLGS